MMSWSLSNTVLHFDFEWVKLVTERGANRHSRAKITLGNFYKESLREKGNNRRKKLVPGKTVTRMEQTDEKGNKDILIMLNK